ncbi:MAG: galactose-1-phosphate uridylyltransferase [candidate division NC10 bacterium]|nr:galactose-1-phosphate uridylyltransferase [candidate division NC10 bacterium]
MPELRQNLATKEWVIIAKERAKRPKDPSSPPRERRKALPFDPSCPFCPGNESKTPEAILTLSGERGWKIRVVPNKFAALWPSGDRLRHMDGVKRWMPGVGFHEVIIETPLHDAFIALRGDEEIHDLLQVYLERYRSISQDKRIELITLFKNHGEQAGTSLPHPHSQLVATPVVPSHIRHRLEEAMRHFDNHGECVFCAMLREEIRYQERIILEDDYFVAFVPYAAFSPFHTWILPKRHVASFGDTAPDEIGSLAKTLKAVLAKLYYGLDDPDFNYVIRSVPSDGRGIRSFHWYISIVVRMTKAAGFELGSGMFINPALPEEDAGFLREVKV